MQAAAVPLLIGEILCFAGKDFFHRKFSTAHMCRAAILTPVFNILLGILTALGTWIYAGFRYRPDWPAATIGVLGGTALFGYYYAATNAAQSGSYALQSMMSQFGNILVPLLASLLIWHDRPNGLQYTGIVLILAAFYIFNLNDLRKGGLTFGKFKWFLLVFLMNGVYSMVNDMPNHLFTTGTPTDLIITCFSVSAIVSAIYCITLPQQEENQAVHMPPRTLMYAAISSLCGVFAINLLMTALTLIPSYLVYPIGSGSLMIINTLLSRTALHETLKANQYIGIAVAIIAIVLNSIG